MSTVAQLVFDAHVGSDFVFLILTVEDGKYKEKPVQDPLPENRQRKENVRYLPEDSDAQRPPGEETTSECLN